MNHSRIPVIKLKSRRTLANETGNCMMNGACSIHYCFRRISLVACTDESDWVESLSSPRNWVTENRTIKKPKVIMLLRDSHREKPRRSQDVQHSWRNMNLVTKDLELVTPLDEVITFHLHCCLIISSPKNLIIHSRPLSMYTLASFMYGPYDRVCLVPIHISEQHRIIIPLV